MRIVPLPALRDNYIWALIAGQRCIVVDPGDASVVDNFLAAHALTLHAILVTHRHNDHIGGVPALIENWRAPAYGPRSIDVVTQAVSDGERIDLGLGSEIAVMAVPGHTEEHLAYLCGTALFCGDTLFAGGCGRLLGRSSAAELHASLQRLASLPGETQIYCAHEYTLSNLRFAQHVDPGNGILAARVQACAKQLEARGVTLPSSMEIERATNPFLRTHEPAIRQAVEAHNGTPLNDAPAVFAALRAWKDSF